mmetsp:Transcript_4723/g.12372  ORF Transcript_4723/g.12372 Transcript_4723/m.12372 type:complete len:207 (+) Transcript_4723:898-1518(+)
MTLTQFSPPEMKRIMTCRHAMAFGSTLSPPLAVVHIDSSAERMARRFATFFNTHQNTNHHLTVFLSCSSVLRLAPYQYSRIHAMIFQVWIGRCGYRKAPLAFKFCLFFFSELVHLPCMEHVVSSRQHSCFPHPSRARTSTRTRTTKVRRSARRCTAYPLAAELVVLVVAEPPLLLNDCMFLTVVVSSIVSHDYGQAMNRPKLWPLL